MQDICKTYKIGSLLSSVKYQIKRNNNRTKNTGTVLSSHNYLLETKRCSITYCLEIYVSKVEKYKLENTYSLCFLSYIDTH